MIVYIRTDKLIQLTNMLLVVVVLLEGISQCINYCGFKKSENCQLDDINVCSSFIIRV